MTHVRILGVMLAALAFVFHVALAQPVGPAENLKSADTPAVQQVELTPAIVLAKPLVKKAEGLSLKWYSDTAGVRTIGWGHAVNGFACGLDLTGVETITLVQAEALLDCDLKAALDVVMRHHPEAKEANEIAAALALCFNIGATEYLASRFARHWKAGLKLKASNDMLRFVLVTHPETKVKYAEPALVLRRMEERDLFLGNGAQK